MEKLKNALKKVANVKKSDREFKGVDKHFKCGCSCQGNFCR